MSQTSALLLSGLLGLVIGIIAMSAFFWSNQNPAARRLSSNRIRPEPEPELSQDALSVLTALPSAYIVTDSDADIVRFGPRAQQLGLVKGGGREHPRLVQKEVIALVLRSAKMEVGTELSLQIENGAATYVPTVHVHVRVAPISRGLFLITIEDQTAAHRLEQTRRDFVANISHELKTPISAIALLSETIEDASGEPATVARFASKMRKEAARLGTLVTNIIELSRLQTGQLSAKSLANIDIGDVINEAVDQCQALADARGVDLACGEATTALVTGQRELLVTALSNLIDNAIHYSAPNTNVGIGLKITDTCAEISIRDQGVGIAPENLDRVFERFYRVDQARSRATGGSGLGLSIVKHIVMDHGGDVSVWSELDHGSTFTVKLPLTPPTALERQ